MSVTWTRTRQQVAEAVMRKLGVLAAGETPTAADSSVVYEAMDGVLKSLHHLGILWWKVAGATTDVSLVASTATAATPAGFLFAVTMAVRDTDDYPLTMISHRAYQEIEDKDDTGRPEKVFVDVANSLFYFWPTPDANYTAKLTYQAIADDTVDGSAPDVPQWALLLLRDMVAYRVGDDFGMTEDRMARFAAEYREAERLLRIMNAPRVDSAPVEFVNY